jgi:hypothetical protein
VSDEGQLRGIEALTPGKRTEAVEDAKGGIVRHRRQLEHGQRAALVVPEREVGERPAHVDADRSHDASW